LTRLFAFALESDRSLAAEEAKMTAVSPLAKKLLIKPGRRGALVNAPSGFAQLLEPLPDAASVEVVLEPLPDAPGIASSPGWAVDFVVVFARSMGELDQLAQRVLSSGKPDSLLWIAYPKGGKKAGTDLNRDVLWELMSRHGLAGVTLVAIDDTWSAMRFRPNSQVGR
jgi:hypothetical protein